MIEIKVSKQSNYPVSSVSVRKVLQDFFKKHGITSDSICFVSFVNETKMKQIGKTYYKKDDRVHNVFSFVESEVKSFKYHDNSKIYLGEIIVCFPVCVEEAKMEGKLIQDKVNELVTHSALHLMGIHHKED